MSEYKDHKTMESDQRRRIKIKKQFYGQVDIEHTIASFYNDMTASTAVIGSGNHNEYYMDVDQQASDELRTDKTINWSPSLRELFPARSYGGQSLLCSFTLLCQTVASAMWGRGRLVEGGELLLTLLDIAMAEVADPHFKDRWIHQRLRRDQPVTKRDWEFIKSVMATPDSSHSNWRPHPIHIFIISSIIRRPIIVHQSRDAANSSTFDEEIYFSGIYLPLLQHHTKCIRYPLVFVYKSGRLLPLLFKETISSAPSVEQSSAIPIVSASLEPLEVLYLKDSEMSSGFELLQKYMDIFEISPSSSSRSEVILCSRTSDFKSSGTRASSVAQPQQQLQQQLLHSAAGAEPFLQPATVSQKSVHKSNLRSDLNEKDMRDRKISDSVTSDTNYRNPQSGCLTRNCRRDGSNEYGGKCSVCYVGQQLASLKETNVAAPRKPAAEPSAPNPSILSFNTFLPPESPDEHCASIIDEPCVRPGCRYMQSAFTAPFCYDHAGAVSAHVDEELNDDTMLVSMMEQRCAHLGCNFHASIHTQPYCHEHAISKSSAASEGNSNKAALERIDEVFSLDPSISRDIPRPNVWTGTSLSERISPSHDIRLTRNSPTAAHTSGMEPGSAARSVSMSLLEDSSVNDVIREVESRSKQSTGMCKSTGCQNFGNSKCRGYCHQCFRALGRSLVS